MAEESYSIPFRDFIDSQFAELHRAVQLAATVPKVEGIPLREHVDAIFTESRRALEALAAERDKADSLRQDAHARATALAEGEREKAASALRTELSRAISEGDERLREHVSNQITQIREALISAEKLELARIDAVERQFTLVQEASETAIAKSEDSMERRFDSVNEWRGQSQDRERTQQEQTASLTSTFLPREVAEAQFADIRRSLADLLEKVGKLV